MKIGVSTSTFFNTVKTEGIFDVLRKLNVDTTEFYLNTFSDYEKEYVDELAKSRGGITVAAVSPLATQFEPQLFSPNMRVRNDAEAIFRKVCYACFALGAKYYTFKGQINLFGEKDFDYQKLSQRYTQLADIAASYGISLSLKNMRWSYASTPEFFRHMAERCPRLYASFSLFHAESAGYDIREFLDAFPAQRISLIDVQDFVKTDFFCMPGRGKYRFDKLFADIERRKIYAPVMLAASPNYSDIAQVREGYEYLLAQYKLVHGNT